MPSAQVSVDIEIDCREPIAVHECRGLQETRRRYAVLRPGPCVWDCDLRKQLRSAPDQQQRSLVPQTHSVTFPDAPKSDNSGKYGTRRAVAKCAAIRSACSLVRLS